MTLPFDRLGVVVLCGMSLAAGRANAQSIGDVEARVRSLFERGEWAEAARLAAETSAHSPSLDLYRGLALAKLGRLDEAERAFLDGLEANPGDSRFLLELAGIAYRNQDTHTAKSRLKEALRLDPASDYGNEFLGTLFLLEGNLPAALKYWNRIDKPLVQNLLFAPLPRLQPVLQARAFAISAGQVFTLDRLRTTEANLERLSVFATSQFELTPRPDQRFDLTFRSLERAQPLGGWVGAILPFLRGLPYQTIDVDLYNLGRRAVNCTFLGRWDADKRRIAMNVVGPVRLDPRWRYRLGVDARDENWDLRKTYFGKPGGLDGLILRKIEAGGGLEAGLTSRLQWTSGLWITRRSFQNSDQARFFADSWSFQLRNQLEYRLVTWPEHRVQVDASTLLRTGRVLTGAPSRFAVVEGNLNGVWLPQSKGDDLAVRSQLRAGKTFGALPFDEFFMLGMERDNDLWLRGHVGTRDGRKGSAPLGTQYSLLQTELDRTIVKFPFVRLQMGPFFDAGAISDPSGQFGSRGWMEDAGLEARIKTLGALTWTAVYGRNLRDGRGVFYTSVSR